MEKMQEEPTIRSALCVFYNYYFMINIVGILTDVSALTYFPNYLIIITCTDNKHAVHKKYISGTNVC